MRWAHSLAHFHQQEETLSGDVLLTAAFVSYAGSFSKKYRRELLENLWMPFLRSQTVSILLTIIHLTRDLHLHTFIMSTLVTVSHLSFRQLPIPMTEGLDPVSMLTDGATVAQWNNEGLPGDKMSTQNATILTNCCLIYHCITASSCFVLAVSLNPHGFNLHTYPIGPGERWPLLIDPQLQGIKWIKNRYGSGLKVVSLGQKG